MSSAKPLPALPDKNGSIILSLSSQEHLTNILQSSLRLHSLPVLWTSAILRPLEQLARYITQGTTLTSAQIKRQEQFASQKTLESSHHDEISGKSITPPDSTAERDSLLRRLYASINENVDGSEHILLTAAPNSTLPTQDADFDVIPAGFLCRFEPSIFHIPYFDDDNGVQQGVGGVILSGFHSWCYLSYMY